MARERPVPTFQGSWGGKSVSDPLDQVDVPKVYEGDSSEEKIAKLLPKKCG